MSRFDKYMGIPFADEGRSFDGCNCLGLYALILANEAGSHLDLPALSAGEDVGRLAERVAAEIGGGAWRLVARGSGREVKGRARLFDAIEMTVLDRGRAPLHVGCALGDGMMIHTERSTGPRCLPMSHPAVSRRIVAVWRPALMGCAA